MKLSVFTQRIDSITTIPMMHIEREKNPQDSIPTNTVKRKVTAAFN
jgi:hypothetical protein